jgi:uncharacterized protein DUF1684
LVNIQSTTTGAFGSVIQTSNEFGQNQERLRQRIQDAIDQVWLPLRRIEPADGQSAQSLLADMTPDVLIYLAKNDPNFLFQLSPDVWAAFPADTTHTVLAYLASQTEVGEAGKSALRQLVDQEIIPQLDALDVVANITVGGGQVLPGEESALAVAEPSTETTAPSSLLLKLSREVWAVVGQGELNQDAVNALSGVAFEIPETPPPLPASWQMDHFSDASDIVEMRTLTRTLAAVFNNFYTSGHIVGALEFTLKGQPLKLTAFNEVGTDPGSLFVAFGDLTNATETYAAGRFMDLFRNTTGIYEVDFNRAYVPYCYYNPTYECPLPPPENRLKIPIRAGERMKKSEVGSSK